LRSATSPPFKSHTQLGTHVLLKPDYSFVAQIKQMKERAKRKNNSKKLTTYYNLKPEAEKGFSFTYMKDLKTENKATSTLSALSISFD
jgi:hypothetical protein